MPVAVVDYTEHEAPARLARSMRETGFVILVNHPIPVNLVPAICDEWLAFFSTGSKHAYRHAENAQDGYFPPPDAAQATSGEFVRDRKEFFHVRPGSPYPKEVSGAALRYFEEARALGATLLEWLERNTPAAIVQQLSMPLSRMIEGSIGSVLRIQHYLPLTGDEPPGTLRAVAHEDINLITLLPTPKQPGLQIRGMDGAWSDIPFDSRSMIVNGGEMLHLASGGYYPATPHRVKNPTGTQGNGSRLSLPLFIHPAADVVLAPGRTASSFLQERIDALRTKGWLVVPGGGRARRPEDRSRRTGRSPRR